MQMPKAPKSTAAPQFSGNVWKFQEHTGTNAIHDWEDTRITLSEGIYREEVDETADLYDQ